MKAWHLISIPVVCVFFGALGFGQSHSSRTYTSPDGVFEFKYPDPLILCKKGHQTDPQTWEPDQSCGAYIPPCDDSEGSGGVVACAAYPHEKYAGTNLAAAAFVVSEIRAARTEAACLASFPQRDYAEPT